MWNNPSGGKHLCKRADLSVSQNSLTTSPNKHSLPTPTQKADTTTPSPSASPASCSKSTSTTPTATNKWLLATDQVRQALQLSRVPDHTTLYRTFAKLSQQQWQQQGRRAAAAPPSERNDRRCGHHRLSQRHGKCVLSEPSREYAACVAQGRVCGGYREPVDCGDAGGARSWFRREVVSPVACPSASVCGTQGAFGTIVAVGGRRV